MSGLTISQDSLLGGNILIQQYKEAYRVAIDPILLAASIHARAGEKVLEPGCGVGAASLCLAHRVPKLSICGIEKEKAFYDLARENVTLNKMDGIIDIQYGDIASHPFKPESFDWVMANPPYLARGKVSVSPHFLKAAANVENEVALRDWIDIAGKAVKFNGFIAFIHRWDRLSELQEGFSSLGKINILPLAGKIGAEPKRVIIQVQKGEEKGVELLSPFILHREDGSYTEEAENILRHGKALKLT